MFGVRGSKPGRLALPCTCLCRLLSLSGSISEESGAEEREGSVTSSLTYQAKETLDHYDPCREGATARLQRAEDKREIKEWRSLRIFDLE